MMTTSTGRTRRGFTLIELLVVVAIIALLIGILLPSVAGARRAAWQISGASIQRQLALGVQMYAAENKEAIPGINGNALKIWNAFANGNLAQYVDQANRDPSMAVQSYDWITASLSGDDLPVNRVERFVHILSRYRDPAMNQTVVPYSGGGTGTSDAVAWVNAKKKQPIGPSFLMPAHFQWGGFSGQPYEWDPAGSPVRIFQVNSLPPTDKPFTTPRSYRPRITNISLAADKICIADGFRYHEGSIIDIDMGVDARLYGTFTSSGTLFKRSTAYGDVGSGNPSDGAQMPLSYRHNGKMNVTYWDGHGGLLSVKESRNPINWYPSDSIYSGGDAVSEVAELGYAIGEKVP